jgi:hypothetical protein
MPFLWNIPLLLCFAASGALVTAIQAVEMGEYFNAVALVGVAALCCWGAREIFRYRRQRRNWG